MKNAVKNTLIATFLLVILTSCDNQSGPQLKVVVGERFPKLEMKNVISTLPRNLDYPNKELLILNIWATWCAPCRHEMPSFQRLSTKLDKGKFEVIGLSVDHDEHVVQEFLFERKIKFAAYMDPTKSIASEVLGVRVYPSTFFVSPDGTLLEVIEGWKDWDTPEMVAHIKGLYP